MVGDRKACDAITQQIGRDTCTFSGSSSLASLLVWPVLEGDFQLVLEGIGSALSGIIVSQKEGWVINGVTVHVRIKETRELFLR
jgi:hypothetical protein